MPCSRQSALTGAPASACFNIASIWLSLYLDFFMQNLLHIVYEKILLMNSVIIRGDYPAQRFQTDRGREFFAEKVQKAFMEYGIKFRPNKPASPHLNGKVERSQKTDKAEFYATVDLDAEDLDDQLADRKSVV